MPEIGDKVEATVVGVVPDKPAPVGIYRGYCTVTCEWGTYNLVNGSVQTVPQSDQVEGTVGFLRWSRRGGYNGPTWEQESEQTEL